MARFERSLYADPGQDLVTTWWEQVERYQHLRRPDGIGRGDWAAKIHLTVAPVYYHNYLLGQMTASQLEATLARELGAGEPGRRSGRGRRAAARAVPAARREAALGRARALRHRLAAHDGGVRGRARVDASRYRCSSMRVLPSVFGFTRSRSRNSATPSSNERRSSS